LARCLPRPGRWTGQSSVSSAAQGFETAHLRVNNPIDATLTFALPTSGFESVVLYFETRRSGLGAGQQTLSYTTDGQTWTVHSTYPVLDANPQIRSVDLSTIGSVRDNANFAVRISFAQGNGGGKTRWTDGRIVQEKCRNVLGGCRAYRYQ
jgi:hypothetical protein